MNKTKLIPIVAAVAALLLAGCSHKYSAERDGKDIGESLCDLADATSADQAKSAISDIQSQLDDLGSKYSISTNQDRRAIDENLNDLAKHATDGDQVLVQQDLAVIQRNAQQMSAKGSDVSSAAWDGVLQGLSDCTQ